MPNDFRKPGGKRPPRQSLSEEIIQLDQEFLRLLARRARLLEKMRGRQPHAAKPDVIQSEKKIRTAWEREAAKLSRDPRAARELYALIQDLSLPAIAEGDALSAFNLAPLRSPVNLALHGVADADQARVWLALAAASGRGILLSGVQRGQALADFAKALVQAGCATEWTGGEDPSQGTLWNGSLALTPAGPLRLTDRSLFVGGGALGFYLLVFLALNSPGKVKFSGTHELKSADFSALARFVPAFGARLGFVMPSSRGLPAALECSADLPDFIEIPEDLPREALLALLTAALTWGRKITFGLGKAPAPNLPWALEKLRAPLAALPGLLEEDEGQIRLSGSAPAALPEQVEIPLDPVLSAYLLSLPFFCGGRAALAGAWPKGPESAECARLLKGLGLKLEEGVDELRTLAGEAMRVPALSALPEKLRPLFWAACARAALRSPGGAALELAFESGPESRPLEPDGMAAEFLERLGIALESGEKGLTLKARKKAPRPAGQSAQPAQAGPQGREGDNAQGQVAREAEAGPADNSPGAWASPGPYWTLAYSLAAFARSGLKLSNPDSVTGLLPGYWQLYNSLPDPLAKAALKAAPKPDGAPAKRRVMLDASIKIDPDSYDYED